MAAKIYQNVECGWSNDFSFIGWTGSAEAEQVDDGQASQTLQRYRLRIGWSDMDHLVLPSANQTDPFGWSSFSN